MTKLLIISSLIVLVLVGCQNESYNESIKQIWVSDIETSFTSNIWIFDESQLLSIHIRQDYEDIRKEIDSTKWSIVNDTLFFINSNGRSKYQIRFLNEDSLVIENSYIDEAFFTQKVSFYSISKSKNIYTKTQLDEILHNNSFIVKPSFEKIMYDYEFVANNKCIDKFDSLNFQLEYWEIIEINNEVFLISKNGISTGLFHLLDINNDSLSFELIYGGRTQFSFTKSVNVPNEETENLLINKWFNYSCNYDSLMPPPPLPPNVHDNKNGDYIFGISYQFLADKTYVYRDGFLKKEGIWELSSSKNYILLDSLENDKEIIQVLSIDCTQLLIAKRNREGETVKINLSYKIK